MRKNYNLISQETFETITGPIIYNLTNDYMFKATLQECQEVLPGLIGALLYVDPLTISAKVTNPIMLGKSIASKDFYLDVRITVNNALTMNLEMQVQKFANWNDRTTGYTSRLFDNLLSGQDYDYTTPVHHIGFLSFDAFEKNNKFYDTFMLKNEDNSLIYTDKFKISVVNLNSINTANELDKQFKLDKWARLFTAQTWEELREISKEDSYMEATARKLFALSSDFDIQEEARRRKEYYRYVGKLEKEIKEKDEALSKKDEALDKKDARIAELEAQLAKLN